ncbi:MAG: tetratricopeptide repeat protein [Candidatus Margulisbacteria bacterium]|nr:tetratricopeptide repeat protein [Candidatus Margulisiibacteriota bacterium]
MAIRRNFCPYCGRKLHWFGIPEVELSKPILQAILKRKNFLVRQKLQHIKEFYFREKVTEIPLLELQDAINLNPQNIKARFQLALYYIEKKRHDKAKEEFNEILKIDPKNVNAFFQLGNIAVEEKNFEEAITYCEKILEYEPDNVGAMYNKAVGYYYLGDLQKALDEFRAILLKEPENEDVPKAIQEISSKLN